MKEQKPEDWKKHLKAMTEFARQRRECTPVMELAMAHRYIRVGGNGFRPVSIHPQNPCGALYKDDDPAIKIGNTRNLGKAIMLARKARQLDGEPGTSKKEHHLQAYLIRAALSGTGKWHEMLDCRDLFDELVFLSDEFRLGDIRADLIALGRKGSSCFPVFLELKADRSLTLVQKQLDKIKARMDEDAAATAAFLAAASGVPVEHIHVGSPKCIFVLPERDDGKTGPVIAGNPDHSPIAICYREDPNDSSYSFERVR